MNRTIALVMLMTAGLWGCAPVKTAPLPDDPVAGFPRMTVGDAYSFIVSGMDQEQWKVTKVNSDGSFLLLVTGGGAAEPRVVEVDHAYRVVGDRKRSLGNLKIDFPLFPGKRWSHSFDGEDQQGRQATLVQEYQVDGYETVQTNAGALQVFKVTYFSRSTYAHSDINYNELWYAPEAKMIVFNLAKFRSHKLLAYSVTADPGSRAAARPAPALAAAAGGVQAAEEKVAAALKAQQEKEAVLKARALQLAEREAALKAEANRLAEAKLAADTRQLEEREAALKAEAARLAGEQREAAAKAKKDREAAAKALAAAKAKAEAENIEANIPVAARVNGDAIAVVIGNRDYRNARKVSFAVSDAELLKKYLVSALGYKDGNVFFLANATKAEFELYFGNDRNHRGKLFHAVKEGRSDVFIYYSGHGAPGLKDRKGYFVPVEADPQYLELSGYPLDVLYENLAKLPARSTTVVLDACFSGSTVYENISPLVLEVQSPAITAKNMVVLTSAGGTQVSSWYHEKNHSLFTYFLLKALKDRTADSNGDGRLTYDEIYSYLADKSEGVPYYARRINGVEQDPTIAGQYQGRVLASYEDLPR